MTKRARRLWFGDWQRDNESALPELAPDRASGDTFVVTPDEDDDGTAAAEAPRADLRLGVAALAVIALLFALGIALSNRRNDQRVASERPRPAPAQVQPGVPQPQIPPGAPPSGFGGPDLTGPEATRAAAAALARYPGSVERVTRGPTGGDYIVHVFQADGAEVHVLVGRDFHVQGSDAGAAPRNNLGPGRSQ